MSSVRINHLEKNSNVATTTGLQKKSKNKKINISLPDVEDVGITGAEIDTRLYRTKKREHVANNSIPDEYTHTDAEEDGFSDLDSKSDSDDSDISGPILSEELLNCYEYIIDAQSGIRLYNGVLLDTKNNISNNIDFYKIIAPKIIFEPISSSTLTAKGLIANLDFHNESVISKMSIPIDQKIIKIGCNEEEIYIFPNDYVDYNIAHLLDILKNSKNTKYKTRIECRCQNLLDHIDNILAQYEDIKVQITALKDSDIIKRIERYLANQKNRNRTLLDKIIKVFKKIMGYIFHPYLFENSLDIAIGHLFDQLEHNVDFERNDNIHELRALFVKVIRLVSFFKEYIARCRCIKQPYNAANKIHAKLIAEDIKKVSTRNTARTHKYIRRKTQGCGKYFSSQITFEIYGMETDKIYKIKIFRNGNFQAPGIKHKDMRDIIAPLNTLTTYLRSQFAGDIRINYIISVMRNYLSYIRMPQFESTIRDFNNKYKIIGTHIYLDKLDERCRQEKNALYIEPNQAMLLYNLLSAKFQLKIALRIYDYMHITTLKITGISNNSERAGGILLKFDRPMPDKPNKKMTLKIMANGKINFDGCNSELEVYELYYWLNNLFRRYIDELVFDRRRLYETNPSDDEGYDSIYDE